MTDHHHTNADRKFGIDLFIEQLAHWQSERLLEYADDYAETDENWGDSPIEKLFFFSLVEFLPRSLGIDILKRTDPPGAEDTRAIWISRQVNIEDVGRVDFVIYAIADWDPKQRARVSRPYWRKLVVECDGHNFHERTKKQAERDRSRDRALQLKGYELFRFTGSELWKNPISAAEQVCDWVQAGW